MRQAKFICVTSDIDREDVIINLDEIQSIETLSDNRCGITLVGIEDDDTYSIRTVQSFKSLYEKLDAAGLLL